MTLTLVVVGLVLAPPTGWLLGGWLADLTAGSQAERSGRANYKWLAFGVVLRCAENRQTFRCGDCDGRLSHIKE